jgi:hypothetical protein
LTANSRPPSQAAHHFATHSPASLRSASSLVGEILILYIRVCEQDVNAVAKVKKRMGRPPVGSKPITVKAPPTQLAILKGRIKTQLDKPTLP